MAAMEYSCKNLCYKYSVKGDRKKSSQQQWLQPVDRLDEQFDLFFVGGCLFGEA